MKMILASMLVAGAFAAPASAAVILDYQLNGSLADSLGGNDIINNGGALGAQGISFGPNQGPTIGGFSNLGTYSIVVEFSFETLTSYQKILDFQNGSSDLGLYALEDFLYFYDFAISEAAVLSAGQLHRLVLTRSEPEQLVVGYLDGVEAFNFADTSGAGVIESNLALFQDDSTTDFEEAASGFVGLVQVHDTVLSASEVAGFGLVPEPESWALMIMGFGLVGATLRRRRGAALQH